jgi:signal transduction histidine kinase/ligand-binding sensor domain-containing protein
MRRANRPSSAAVVRWLFLFAIVVVQHPVPSAYSRTIFPEDSDLRIEHLTTRDGLSQSLVYAMCQDREGFIWLGTRDGLDKYDGYRFRTYRYDPFDTTTVSGRTITAIVEDRDGNIWAGTMNGGINRLDRRTGRFQRLRDEPAVAPLYPSGVLTDWLTADSSGNIWVVSEKLGLERFDSRTGRFIRYLPGAATGLPPADHRSVHVDRQGRVWVGSARTISDQSHTGSTGVCFISRFDPVADRFTTLYTSSATGLFFSLGEQPDGRIAFALRGVDTKTEAMVYMLDPVTAVVRLYDVPSRQARGGVVPLLLPFFLDEQGMCWYSAASPSRFTGPHGRQLIYRERLVEHDPGRAAVARHGVLPQPRPIAIGPGRRPLCDRSGVVWLPLDLTVARITLAPPVVRTWRSDENDPRSLSARRIRDIHVDRSGDLWAATDFGLNRYDPQMRGWRRYFAESPRENGLPHSTINVIHQDRDGSLLFGTNNGLVTFDRSRDRFTAKYPELAGSNLRALQVWSLLRDGRGRLWCGTYYDGLARLDSTGVLERWYRTSPGDSSSITGGGVWTLHEDRHGTIWIGTNDGLCRWIPETESFRRYYHRRGDPRSLGGGQIWDIHEDRSGSLWVSSYGGGISRYNRETDDFTTVTARSGLVDDGVFGMLEDESGIFWISTTRGLVRWERTRNDFRVYDERDGLQGREFALKALHKGPDGTLYFGGIDGLSAFNPADITTNIEIPPVVITGFSVFGRSHADEIPSGDTIVLDHGQNFFTIEFAALDFSAPTKNRYRYILEGVDPAWVAATSDQRRASYTDLEPGHYTFRVQGSNNDGIWNDRGAVVTLIISPPWWGRWWVRALAATIALGAILLAIRMKLKTMRRHEAEKREAAVGAALEMQEKERERIARDLHDGVGQLLAAAHVNLSRIDIDPEPGRSTIPAGADAGVALDRARVALGRAIVDVRAISHVLGNSTVGELGLVAALEEAIGGIGIDGKTRYQFLVSGMEEGLPDNIQSGLFRIAQELITNVERHAGASEATIQIVRTPEEIRLTVEDDGVGFEPSSACSGMGRGNIEARAHALGGDARWDSTPGHGTTVTVSVPASVRM